MTVISRRTKVWIVLKNDYYKWGDSQQLIPVLGKSFKKYDYAERTSSWDIKLKISIEFIDISGQILDKGYIIKKH